MPSDIPFAADQPSFAELLHAFRMAAALSQEALAARAGLSVRAISDLERGVKTRPYLGTVGMLADALNLTLPDRRRLILAARPETATDQVPAPPAPPPGLRGQLPLTAMTSLVGRDRELERLTEMARSGETRLITLTGTGGVGKTRLALAAAQHLAADYPNGAWFVDLAPIRDPDLVLATISQVISMQHAGQVPLLEQLVGFLRPRRLLLVIDNFEHVIQAAASIGRLVAESPELLVIATSRVPLRVSLERELFIEPLALPDAGVHQAGEALQCPAVKLFQQRAQSGHASFVLNDENAAAIVRICRMVDGLPLAIELAAARVGTVPPAIFLERFSRRLPLLTHGPLDAPDRQRALHLSVAWSHELLDPAEQTLFRRLAVFQGGWTLAAAEAICDPDGELDVFELLDALVSKNMLVAPDAGYRFRMLETIREFAADQLAGSGEEHRIRKRHAEFLAQLAEESQLAQTSFEPAGRIPIEPERDNVRAAIEWCIEVGEAELGLRLAGALWQTWFAWGDLSGARSLISRLLALPGAESDCAVWARAIGAAGALAQAQGDHAQAVRYSERALAAAQEVCDQQTMAAALHTIGLQAMVRGQYARARTFLEGSRRLFMTASDRRAATWALRHLSTIAVRCGRMAEATPLAEAALVVAQRAGWPSEIAGLLHTLGRAVAGAGDLNRAEALWNESLAYFQDSADRWGVANSIGTLGWLSLQRREFGPAAAQLEESLHLYEEVGDPEGIVVQLCQLGWLHRAQGDRLRAASLFDQGVQIARTYANPSTLATALLGAGAIALDRGDRATAGRLWQESLELADELGELGTVASVLEWCARLADPDRASLAGRLRAAAQELHRRLGSVTYALHGTIGSAGPAPDQPDQEAVQELPDMSAGLERTLEEVVSAILDAEAAQGTVGGLV